MPAWGGHPEDQCPLPAPDWTPDRLFHPKPGQHPMGETQVKNLRIQEASVCVPKPLSQMAVESAKDPW